MIRKRLLSACLALALCLSLLPVTALAAAPNGQVIYVGNVNVTNGGYWTIDSDGNVTASTAGDTLTENYIHYDAGDNTLTLHNATIKKGLDYNESIQGGTYILGSAIGVFNQNGDAELTITLEGTNTIEDVSTGIFVLAHSPSTGDATLTITGSGSLDASGILNGILVQSNGGDATLTIQSADVTLTSNSGNGVTVQAGSTNSSGEHTITLSVEGGSLTASGSTGISFDSASSYTVSATNLTVSNNAIVRANDVGSNISNVDLQIGKGNNSSGGIVFDGNQGTVYGSVTLQEDLEIGEGESLTLDDGASLNAGDYDVIVDGGTLDSTLATNLGESVIYKVTKVELDKTSLTLNVGDEETLIPTITPDNATDKSVTWESSASGVATVDTSGKVTAVSVGTATITATAADGSGEKATCSVTVDAAATVPVESVSLDKTSLELTEGETTQLTATVLPDNASNKNVTWSTSNASIATVNNGEVTAVSAGTATITATAEDGSKTATCTVTVKPAEYTVTVLANGNGSASASPATAEAGTTVTLTAKPDSGWRFSRWEVVEGDVTISGNSFTMPADNVTVRAVFSPIVNLPDTYAIDLIVGEGGEARLSLTNASEGSTITVTATPDDGYELDYITVDGERISGTTFKMPGHDVTVRVYFTDDAALPFTDVSAGAWYFDAVGYVYVGGLMDGVSDTLFDPDGTMTRAMVWAILARVDGETVTGEDWIETAREWAMSEGVSDGENANGYVTREQLATMLYRYAVYKGYDVSIGEDTNILSYADFADLSEYAIPAMQWACGAGVITGVTDATLVPQGEATRAQVAAMLMRFVEAIG